MAARRHLGSCQLFASYCRRRRRPRPRASATASHLRPFRGVCGVPLGNMRPDNIKKRVGTGATEWGGGWSKVEIREVPWQTGPCPFFFDGIARIPPVFGAHPVLQSSRLPEYGKIPTLYLWGQPASQPAYQIGWYQQRKSGGAPLAKKRGSRSALKHGLADVSGVNGRNRWTK